MSNPDSDSQTKNTEEDDISNKTNSPRETLINTAVTFLSNKKIQNQDPKIVKQFLIKKGLTEEETTIAFQRIQTSKNQSLLAEYGRPGTQMYHLPPPLQLPPPAPSMWQTVHNIVTTVTSIGGILYAIYWLWKTYISPYLFGRRPKKKPVETSLAQLEAAVSGCVADVKTVRSSLEILAAERAAELTHGVVVTRIQEVKTEVASLKALLLNRNQFPATPVPLGTSPLSIPAWQMSADDTSHPEQEGEAEEEGSGSNGTTNGSDSSLEIVKDPNN